MDIDCQSVNEITCPYCGYKFENSWEYGDDGDLECHECEREFYFSTYHTVSYSSRKMDCDPTKHEFEPWTEWRSVSHDDWWSKRGITKIRTRNCKNCDHGDVETDEAPTQQEDEG